MNLNDLRMSLKAALDNMWARIDARITAIEQGGGGGGGSVTGVKGDAEANYRTGNVNLTPANIGAAAADTHRYAMYNSVEQLNLTPSAVTVVDAFNAMPSPSILIAPAGEFASNAVPNTTGAVEIVKNSNRNYVYFYGKMQSNKDYRMWCTSNNVPDGVWHKVANDDTIKKIVDNQTFHRDNQAANQIETMYGRNNSTWSCTLAPGVYIVDIQTREQGGGSLFKVSMQFNSHGQQVPADFSFLSSDWMVSRNLFVISPTSQQTYNIWHDHTGTTHHVDGWINVYRIKE